MKQWKQVLLDTPIWVLLVVLTGLVILVIVVVSTTPDEIHAALVCERINDVLICVES